MASTDSYEWSLILNPSVAGTFTYSDVTNSALQTAIGNGSTNTVTGGTRLLGGYGDTRSILSGDQFKNLLKLGSSISGTMDSMVLCIYILSTNNSNTYAGLNYRQFG